MALQVPSLDALAAELEQQDMKLLEPEHVKGAGDFLCNFLSPVYAHGVHYRVCPIADAMKFDDSLLKAEANNFTLVRLILASSVIYTHCYWLATGLEDKDDLSGILGAPISSYAVDGFFFLSGFLVYPSLLRLASSSRFLLARLTRLWPGLATSVLVTVLAGLALASTPGLSYLSGDTARFIGGNLTFLKGYYTLTGITCGAEPCNVNRLALDPPVGGPVLSDPGAAGAGRPGQA